MNSAQPKKSPLEILISEFLPAEVVAAVETQVKTIQELPGIKRLADLQTPIYGNDPTELLKYRFLYRGGLALLCGPTGIGKSSLLMQAAIHWAVGLSFFGIVPGDVFQRSGMRILIVQAENDEGDLAEMRDGVLAGCTDLSDEARTAAGDRIKIATITDKSEDAFAATLDGLLVEKGPFDLVLIDPAFAYLGGDGNSQKDVSHFMRELLNPLAQKHGVGVILAHHTNKPMKGKEKENWTAGDYAYLGAGSAEWINPARAALALRSIGSDTVFELRAVKRGRRLRWVDENGLPTNVQYIAHHLDAGVICWRKATAEEVAELLDEGKGGRRKQYDDIECVHAVRHQPGESQEFYVALISDRLSCGKSTALRMLKQCVAAGCLAVSGDRHQLKYSLTAKGAQAVLRRPSAVSWGSDFHNAAD
jgi:hypothetical protein